MDLSDAKPGNLYRNRIGWVVKFLRHNPAHHVANEACDVIVVEVTSDVPSQWMNFEYQTCLDGHFLSNRSIGNLDIVSAYIYEECPW